VYGVGQLGPLADLSWLNLSLRLIGCPVQAYGCSSHAMSASIVALFYRNKAIGGFDYVADFLIGPRGQSPFSTRPGDSGAARTRRSPGRDVRLCQPPLPPHHPTEQRRASEKPARIRLI
jgi:hypothetical protein